MEEKLFKELTTRRLSPEDARIVVSAIRLIIDTTQIEPQSSEMQQVIYALTVVCT